MLDAFSVLSVYSTAYGQNSIHSPSISLEFLLERMDYCIIIIKLNTSSITCILDSVLNILYRTTRRICSNSLTNVKQKLRSLEFPFLIHNVYLRRLGSLPPSAIASSNL
jgi:hypothetical protein